MATGDADAGGGGVGDLNHPKPQNDERVVPPQYFLHTQDCPEVKETYFHTCLIRDSVQVQRRHKVNDDEVHEGNARLDDYLVLDHSFHFNRRDRAGKDSEAKPDETQANTNESPDETKLELERTAPKIIDDDKIVKETYFHTCLIKSQNKNKVNDDELHEENPHLEDYLEPVERPDKTEAETKDIAIEKAIPAAKGKGILQTETRPRGPEEKSTRKVQFGTVLVRKYDMILGDHPSCSYGPPVTIDWDYLEYKPLNVNDYEFHHPPRRNMREMGMNYYYRKGLLSRAGFTDLDFKRSKKEMNRIKLSRSITRQLAAYPLVRAQAAVESAHRKVKRLIKEDHWKQHKSLYMDDLEVSRHGMRYSLADKASS
ncbi:hypothetical protein ACHAWF_003004 [Thalassiosira exigua]